MLARKKVECSFSFSLPAMKGLRWTLFMNEFFTEFYGVVLPFKISKTHKFKGLFLKFCLDILFGLQFW